MGYMERLVQIRKQKGLSQATIAELLNTTQQQYSKYENGQHELPVHHLITLCNYFKVSADYILDIKL